MSHPKKKRGYKRYPRLLPVSYERGGRLAFPRMIERNLGSPPLTLDDTLQHNISLATTQLHPGCQKTKSADEQAFFSSGGEPGHREGCLAPAIGLVRVCVRVWVEREKHKVKRLFHILPRVCIGQARNAQLKTHRE